MSIERWGGLGGSDRDAFAREVVDSAPDVIFIVTGAAIGPQIFALTKALERIAQAHHRGIWGFQVDSITAR